MNVENLIEAICDLGVAGKEAADRFKKAAMDLDDATSNVLAEGLDWLSGLYLEIFEEDEEPKPVEEDLNFDDD